MDSSDESLKHQLDKDVASTRHRLGLLEQKRGAELIKTFNSFKYELERIRDLVDSNLITEEEAEGLRGLAVSSATYKSSKRLDKAQHLSSRLRTRFQGIINRDTEKALFYFARILGMKLYFSYNMSDFYEFSG